MSELDFDPWLGGARWSRSYSDRRYLHAVIAVARRSAPSRARKQQMFKGTRLGRGTAAAAALRLPNREPSLCSRRAVIRTGVHLIAGRGLKSAYAHLRYIERDGVTRGGEPAVVYSAADDHPGGREFLKRCAGDRHQFRMVVSLEDGAEYAELKPLVRRFMSRLEEDLGCRVDWVAADHFNSLHPHSHILLRGKDDEGADLVIAPDYLCHGMRERLVGLISVDLGPAEANATLCRLRREVEAERITSLDRRLLEAADNSSIVRIEGRGVVHALLTGRMHKLGALGLAEPASGGCWRLSDQVEPALTALAERADHARTLQRHLLAATLDRATAEQVVHCKGGDLDVSGRLVARGPADPIDGDSYVIVDGFDGRAHYLPWAGGASLAALPDDAIVRLSGQSGAKVELLSPLALESLPAYDGLTWLDRELIAPRVVPRDVGNGRALRLALSQRRLWLIEQGLAAADREFSAQPHLLRALERREDAEIRKLLTGETGPGFERPEPGRIIEGYLRRRVDLASGRYAVIERAAAFALVPWDPVLERAIGEPVCAAISHQGVSWTIGRQRGIGI